jgi:hypothetical protein
MARPRNPDRRIHIRREKAQQKQRPARAPIRWADPAIDSDNRDWTDLERVRYALVYSGMMDTLSGEAQERLVQDLVDAANYPLGGINAQKPKPHVSVTALARHVFMCDVERAMEGVGLPVTRWRALDESWSGSKSTNESRYFQAAHALGNIFGLKLPRNLKPLALRAKRQQRQPLAPRAKRRRPPHCGVAMRVEHGEMSPKMKAAQDAELRASRGQQVALWGETLVEAPLFRGELPGVYLNLPA